MADFADGDEESFGFDIANISDDDILVVAKFYKLPLGTTKF